MPYQQAIDFLRWSLVTAFGCSKEDAARFSWHSIRAASFTAMLEAGFPGKVRRSRVGWREAKSERHYARVDWDLQVQFMRALHEDWEGQS